MRVGGWLRRSSLRPSFRRPPAPPAQPGARGPGALSQRPGPPRPSSPDGIPLPRSRAPAAHGATAALTPHGLGGLRQSRERGVRRLYAGLDRARPDSEQPKNPRRGGEQAWPGLRFRRATRGHPTRPSPPGIGGGFNVSVSPARAGEMERPRFFFVPQKPPEFVSPKPNQT